MGDVLIAASETLGQLAESDAELRKQMLPALSLVQSLIARYERGGQETTRAKDREAVLRSLKKLEAMLYDTAFREHDAGDVAPAKMENASELQEKIKTWNSTAAAKKKKRTSGDGSRASGKNRRT